MRRRWEEWEMGGKTEMNERTEKEQGDERNKK
jgi:hypothetical protein